MATAGYVIDRALHLIGVRQGTFALSAPAVTAGEVVDRALHIIGVRQGAEPSTAPSLTAGFVADRALHIAGVRRGSFPLSAPPPTAGEVVDRALHLAGIRAGSGAPNTDGNCGTATALITRALRLLGVLGEAETPSTGQANDGLLTLVALLNSWETEGVPAFNGLALNSTVALPERHTDALAFSLAVQMAPEYGREPSATVVAIAASKSKRLLDEYRVNPLDVLDDLLAAWEGQGVPQSSRPLSAAGALALPAYWTEAAAYSLAVRLAAEHGTDPKPQVAAIAAEREALMLAEYRVDTLGLLSTMLATWEGMGVPATSRPLSTNTSLAVPGIYAEALTNGLATRLAAEHGLTVQPQVPALAQAVETRMLAEYRVNPFDHLSDMLASWEGLGAPETDRPLGDDTELAVPGYYAEAVVNGLAARLYAVYGVPAPNAQVAGLAQDREARLLAEFRSNPMAALSDMLAAWEEERVPETERPLEADTELELPEKHTEAVVTNLALRLATETGFPAPPWVAERADTAYRRMIADYYRMPRMRAGREYGVRGAALDELHGFQLDCDSLGEKDELL